MRVKAAPGLRVPMEEHPHNCITDADEGVEIAHTHYYVRRLADGDLVEAPAQDEPRPEPMPKVARKHSSP